MEYLTTTYHSTRNTRRREARRRLYGCALVGIGVWLIASALIEIWAR